jgi:RND family efflux transporter MFP subunit
MKGAAMRVLLLPLLMLLPLAASAQTRHAVVPQAVTDWKAVYGRIEAQSRIPARARIGGTLVALDVTEGDRVEAGAVLGRVVDEKLDFRLAAIDGQLQALGSQLENAESELARGEELLARGVTTVQRLDGLRTQVEVLRNQIAAAEAERRVVEQQAAEGAVLAPIAGRVLTVPAAAGAVVMPGEAVATIGGGGFFLRLAVPERHAGMLAEGDRIEIAAASGTVEGRLARLYPQIENGRVIADVAVPALDDAFVDARVPVRLPIGTRMALMVPEEAVSQRFGLDFLRVGEAARVVVLGQRHRIDGAAMVEVLSGLAAGETVVLP